MLSAALCEIQGVAHYVLDRCGELSQILEAGADPRHRFERRLIGHGEHQAIVISLYMSREIWGQKRLPPNWSESQPRENHRAAHTSFIRAEVSWATRFPRRCCDTVTAWCRFTAHGPFIPSSSSRTTPWHTAGL